MLGYTILLHMVRELESNEVDGLLEEMQGRYVDGIIWAVPQIGDNHAWLDNGTTQLGVPIVFLSMEPRLDQNIVSMDNYGGGLTATQHLIDQGCGHIGILTGPLDWWESRQRKAGWEQALESASRPADESYVALGNWSAASGERGLTDLLARHPEIDGLFACNDRMALGVLKAARELGRRVPEDLAVVGFDDIPEAAFFNPPLSTVRQDMVDLGRCAVGRLSEVIEANREDSVLKPDTTLLQPEQIVRRSSILGGGHASSE